MCTYTTVQKFSISFINLVYFENLQDSLITRKFKRKVILVKIETFCYNIKCNASFMNRSIKKMTGTKPLNGSVDHQFKKYCQDEPIWV